MKTFFVSLGIAASACTSFAFGPTGFFAGSLNDDFEAFADYSDLGIRGYNSLEIMGRGATFSSPEGEEGTWVYDVDSARWGLADNGPALTSSGVQGIGLFRYSYVTLEFSTPVSKFGGYFATCDFANYGDFFLDFYSANGDWIGGDRFTTSSNTMVWKGWEDRAGIGRIVMRGNGAPAMDDLTAEPVPEPASLIALGLGALALRRRPR